MSAVALLYRRILKTQRKTFQGDTVGIMVARTRTRMAFAKNQDATAAEVPALLKIGEDAILIIKRNVVQAHKQGDTYVLRVTADTEINSNDTISSGCGQPAQKI